MRQIQDEELKDIGFGILKDVASFCEENGLRYYLCGGTLLGAIRHKGYIPWDDDIDIMMPRPDYEKFLQKYNQSSKKFRAIGIENESRYWNTFAKVVDTRTILDDPTVRVPQPHNGVFIDVFPLDGLPKSRFRQKILFAEMKVLCNLFYCSIVTYTRSRNYDDSFSSWSRVLGYLRTAVKFILLTVFHFLPAQPLIRYINREASRWPFESADEAAVIVLDHYGGNRERMPRTEIEKKASVTFEGKTFQTFSCWKLYLSKLYGDYMQLPPVEKRVTHHGFTAYWKEHEGDAQ